MTLAGRLGARIALVAAAATVTTPAWAATDPNLLSIDEKETLAPRHSPNIATDLLDPKARTRFHLTTRVSASTPDDTFTDDLIRTTFDLNMYLRATRGFSVTAAMPFGLVAVKPGKDTFIIGNLRLGVAGGDYFLLGTPSPDEGRTPTLGLGGAFDVYIPTARVGDEDSCLLCAPVSIVRNMRAFEPESFTDDSMWFRVRGHADLALGPFLAELELGLSPGFSYGDDGEFMMVFEWAARASVDIGPYIEPYLELGSAIHVVNKSEMIRLNPDLSIAQITGYDLTTPAMLTIGLRAHFANLDPAFFTSIDLRDGLIIFGLDLAGAVRDYVRSDTEMRDFMRGPSDAAGWGD